jgi:hypothetical protein
VRACGHDTLEVRQVPADLDPGVEFVRRQVTAPALLVIGALPLRERHHEWQFVTLHRFLLCHVVSAGDRAGVSRIGVISSDWLPGRVMGL